MKNIEFGFANDQVPNGSWEGIGISEGLMITEGEYLGAIEYGGDNYIVCEVEMPGNISRLIVRQALCDIYADGSVQLYLNQAENTISMDIENHINRNGIRENIRSIDDVIKLGNGIHIGPKSFKLVEMDSIIIATSILPEVFDEMNETIKYNQKSMATLAMERRKSLSV